MLRLRKPIIVKWRLWAKGWRTFCLVSEYVDEERLVVVNRQVRFPLRSGDSPKSTLYQPLTQTGASGTEGFPGPIQQRMNR
ncbi:MAG: hypothetical protein ACOVQM_19350, partial [Pirellula sp.]